MWTKVYGNQHQQTKGKVQYMYRFIYFFPVEAFDFLYLCLKLQLNTVTQDIPS